LGKIVTKCLQTAEELSLKSITFPAIGTGILGFPSSVVAKSLFDKVYEFSSKKKTNSLREVHFLLHPKDVNNIQVSYHAFLSQLHAILFGSISWYVAMCCSPDNLQDACYHTEAESSLLTVSFAHSLSCTALLASCPFLFPGNNADESVITLLSYELA